MDNPARKGLLPSFERTFRLTRVSIMSNISTGSADRNSTPNGVQKAVISSDIGGQEAVLSALAGGPAQTAQWVMKVGASLEAQRQKTHRGKSYDRSCL